MAIHNSPAPFTLGSLSNDLQTLEDKAKEAGHYGTLRTYRKDSPYHARVLVPLLITKYTKTSPQENVLFTQAAKQLYKQHFFQALVDPVRQLITKVSPSEFLTDNFFEMVKIKAPALADISMKEFHTLMKDPQFALTIHKMLSQFRGKVPPEQVFADLESKLPESTDAKDAERQLQEKLSSHPIGEKEDLDSISTMFVEFLRDDFLALEHHQLFNRISAIAKSIILDSEQFNEAYAQLIKEHPRAMHNTLRLSLESYLEHTADFRDFMKELDALSSEELKTFDLAHKGQETEKQKILDLVDRWAVFNSQDPKEYFQRILDAYLAHHLEK